MDRNSIMCAKCGKPLYDDHKSTGIPDLCTCTLNVEGSTRKCGHFVETILSFCPVCRDIRQMKEEFAEVKEENRDLTSIKKEEFLRYVKGEINFKVKEKISKITIDKLVQTMTDEEGKVVPEGRNVTRVELAQAVFNFIKEVTNE